MSHAFSSSVSTVDCNLLLRVPSHAGGRNFRIGFSSRGQDNEAYAITTANARARFTISEEDGLISACTPVPIR